MQALKAGKKTICDIFILCLLDQELSERLQIASELTLAKTTQTARQSELVKQQVREQRDLGHPSVDAVRGGGNGHLQRNGHAYDGTGSRGVHR